MLQDLNDWGGKLPGAALRLAGIFQMVFQAGGILFEPDIPNTTMTMALEMATCLISHARCAFALMDQDPAVENGEKLRRWIVRHGKPSFTARDCFRAHQQRFQRVEAMLPILQLLEQHGFIRRVQRDSSGGRPPSDLYDVNPAILPEGAA
jgi:hypothetical protein